MSKHGRKMFGFLVASVSALNAAPASALETIQPYVYGSIVHDNNFFRVADDAEVAAIGSTSKDETIKRIGVGLKLNRPISRQTLWADAAVEKNTYERNSYLNDVAGRGRAGWDWSIGSNINGTLAYSYAKNLSSFAELQTELGVPKKDIHTEHTIEFLGGMNLLADWRAEAGVSRREVRKSYRSELDHRVTGYTGELQYLTAANTYVGGRIERNATDYLHPLQSPSPYEVNGQQVLDDAGRPIFELSPDDSTVTNVSAVAAWEGTSKSHLRVELGKTHFDPWQSIHPNSTSTSGKVVHDWIATAKLRIATVLSQRTEISDERAGYALTKGVEITPNWQVTSKISTSLRLLRKKLDYQGSDARSDTLTAASLAGSYQMFRELTFSASLAKETRNSSNANSDYSDQIYKLGAEYRFY